MVSLIPLARALRGLSHSQPITLWWPTDGVPCLWDAAVAVPPDGEIWTYPDSATAFAVAWYCCIYGGTSAHRRYQAVSPCTPSPQAPIRLAPKRPTGTSPL